MHIAIFTTSLPEPSRKPGGVDVYIQRLADRLAGRGHEVDVYSYSPACQDSDYRHIQLQPESFRHRKLVRLTVVPLMLNRKVPRADVLHLHGDDWFFFRRSLPTVRTFHGSALWEARTAERLTRRLGSSLTFVLEILASRLATSSYDVAPGSGRAFATRGTLPAGIDISPAPAQRAQRPTILFVGAWTGRKRGRLLAEVFAREVLPAVPDARLVMVSDHAEPMTGIEHVVRPSDERVAALMQEAWVMCLPSSYEGFGIPYIEAMAAGTAVVATPNPGALHVLDRGRAGLISHERDLGASLVRMLCDPQLREGFAQRGRSRVQAFAWDRVIDLHERAYEEASQRWRQQHHR